MTVCLYVLLSGLLIVLNGIETKKSKIPSKQEKRLLIVLNGIETVDVSFLYSLQVPFNRTKWNWNGNGRCPPHRAGESFNRTKWNWNWIVHITSFYTNLLLIVLNGIETISSGGCLMTVSSFNRTKWNWNLLKDSSFPCGCALLIVLNGIETLFSSDMRSNIILLIVLNGIETSRTGRW